MQRSKRFTAALLGIGTAAALLVPASGALGDDGWRDGDRHHDGYRYHRWQREARERERRERMERERREAMERARRRHRHGGYYGIPFPGRPDYDRDHGYPGRPDNDRDHGNRWGRPENDRYPGNPNGQPQENDRYHGNPGGRPQGNDHYQGNPGQPQGGYQGPREHSNSTRRGGRYGR